MGGSDTDNSSSSDSEGSEDEDQSRTSNNRSSNLGKTGRSKWKSPRRMKCKAINYEESSEEESDKIDDDEEEEVEKEVRTKTTKAVPPERAKPSQQGENEENICPHCNRKFMSTYGLKYHIDHAVCQKKEENEEEEDDEEETSSENDEDEVESEEDTERKGPAKKAKASASSGNTECPHCQKKLKSESALKYHIDHYVCRVGQRSESESAPSNRKRKLGRSKSNSNSSGGTKYKRFRGKQDDRTCKECGRIFTSVLGLKYHAERKVCQEGTSSKRKNKNDNFHTLEAGEKFVTPYGVVQVVKDDREIPTALLPADIKKQLKMYTSRMSKYESTLTNFYSRRAAQLRVRKHHINNLYSNRKQLNRDSVFEAYEDETPEKMLFKPLPEHPSAPDNSFPDRIIECAWIPDRRTRISGYNCGDDDDQEEGDEIGQENISSECFSLKKMYLRRRLLTEGYIKDGCKYMCPDCGQAFNSQPSQKYHVQNKPCVRKNALATARRQEAQSKIEKAVKILMQNTSVQKRDYRGQKRIRKKKDMGIYPEVLISLGFKLVTASAYDVNEENENSEIAMEIQPTPAHENNMTTPIEAGRIPADSELTTTENEVPTSSVSGPQVREERKKEATLENPTDVLENLRQELKRQQRKTDDHKFGSMYPEVYQKLGFYFPGKRPTIKVIKRIKKKRIRKRAKPSPEQLSLPPILDIRALASEIDSGRYPSMRRCTEEDEHEESCLLCKKGGKLVCCDFCTNVEHYKCLRQKFTVKRPEPKEDFMCHKCIQTILARRNRAQKRRLEKQAEDEEKKSESDLLKEKRQKLKNGNEYHVMAAKGQTTNELLELLKDSQLRLQQSVKRLEMNNLRRGVIARDMETQR